MQTLKEQINIAERLWIPADTQAILWDMDGVLIDSLSLDLVVCNQLLKQHFRSETEMKSMRYVVFSCLTVYDFLKRSSIGYMTKEGYDKIKDVARKFAEYEGFPSHANAISKRNFN